MDSATPKETNSRISSYKHRGKDPDERRRWRNQNTVSLRKVR